MSKENKTALEYYFSEVRKTKVFQNKTEEIDLIKKAQKGDSVALEKVVKGNLRYVISVAKEYVNKTTGLELKDLISAGNEGLVIGLYKYNHKLETNFLVYVSYWIKASILREMYSNSSVVREPDSQIFKRTQKQKEEAKKIKELNDDFLECEKTLYLKPLSLNDTYTNNDDGYNCTEELINRIRSDYNVYDGLDLDTNNIINVEDSSYAIRLMTDLTDNEKNIIKKIFGFEKNEEYSFEALSDEMDLTPERIRQIYNSAIRKLRCSVMENKIKVG